MSDSVITVVVTGAAGHIGYALLYPIAKGEVFGSDQKVKLLLLDIQPMMGSLEGVIMELQDCALPLLTEVVATADPKVGFTDVDVAILVGSAPREPGMVRRDLLKANVSIFKEQGEALDKFAKKSVKVVVVSNPANTTALICKYYAPTIPKEQFTSLTRLDQNRAQVQIAMKLGVTSEAVSNCIIWGNHSSTQYPDVNQAKVNINGEEKAVPAAVQDDSWLKGEFIKTVQTRGAAVIAARNQSSAMSAAKAICDHTRDWYSGTNEGKIVSMGVISDGSYGIDEGLMFSFPVQIKDGKWTIVQDLTIDDFSRERMDLTAKELKEEKVDGLKACEEH